MRKDYSLKITDDKYYERVRYAGETLEEAKKRLEKIRLAQKKKKK